MTAANAFPPAFQPFAETSSTRLLGALGSLAWRAVAPIEVLLAGDDGSLWSINRERRATSWDHATGDPIRSVALESSGDDAAVPTSAALSRDTSRLLVGRRDGRMALYDLATGARLWEVFATSVDGPGSKARGDAKPAPIRDVALSPDGAIAVSAADKEATARVWIGKTPLGEIAGRAPFAFSPDGTLLCLHDVIADVRLGRVLLALPRDARRERLSATFSPDGSALLTGDDRGAVELWNLGRREIVWTARAPELAPGRAASVTRVAVGPDGRTVVSVTAAGVQIWDALSGRLVRDARFADAARVALLPARGRVYAVSGGSRTSIRPFDLQRGVEIDDAGHLDAITSVAASPRAPTAITGSADGTLRLWHLASRTVLRTLDGLGPVVAAAFFPDGRRVAGAGAWRARIWDVATGAVAAEIEKTIDEEVTGLAISPDGALLALAMGGEVRVWDIDRSAPLYAVPAAAKHLAFSPDGASLFAVTTSSTIRALDARTGEVLGDSRIEGDPRAELHAFLSGGRVVSVLAGVGLALRDFDGGAVRARFPGSSGEERLLAVSPDERVAVTSAESRLTLWDLARMQRLDVLDLASATDRPVSAAFTPDGASLLAGTARGVLLHFEVRVDPLPVTALHARIPLASSSTPHQHVPQPSPSTPHLHVPQPAPSSPFASPARHEEAPRSDPRPRAGLPTSFRQLIPSLRQMTRDNEENLAFHLSRLERVPVASLYHPADTLAIRAAGLGVAEVSGWFVRFEPYVLAGLQFIGQHPAADRIVQTIAMLKFLNTAQCCGARLPPIVAAWEPAWLDALAARSDEIDERDRTTLAFAALALPASRLVPVFTGNEPLPARVEPGQTFGFSVGGFVRYLAVASSQGLGAADVEPAFIDFVRNFVRKMVVESLDGCELMYAARAYFVNFERRPPASVAQALHDLVTS